MRTRTRALWSVFVAAALPLLFLAAYAATTRWLLSGRSWEIINASPRSFTIDWDEAVSRWPGRVSLRNLRLRGSDPNVEWTVRLENAELRYSVLALLRRTFLCKRLDGSGLAFALRTRIDPKKLKSVDVSLLPPIHGVSGSSLALAGGDAQRRIESLARGRPEGRDRSVRGHLGGRAPLPGAGPGPGRLPAAPDASGPHRRGARPLRRGSAQIGRASEGFTVTGSLATMTKPFEPPKTPCPRPSSSSRRT